MDENYLREEILRGNFEEKTHINESNSWISSEHNDGGTYEMYVNYLYPPKFDGDNVEDGRESRWENAKEIAP